MTIYTTLEHYWDNPEDKCKPHVNAKCVEIIVKNDHATVTGDISGNFVAVAIDNTPMVLTLFPLSSNSSTLNVSYYSQTVLTNNDLQLSYY